MSNIPLSVPVPPTGRLRDAERTLRYVVAMLDAHPADRRLPADRQLRVGLAQVAEWLAGIAGAIERTQKPTGTEDGRNS